MEVRTEDEQKASISQVKPLSIYQDGDSKQVSTAEGSPQNTELRSKVCQRGNLFTEGVTFKRVERRLIKPPAPNLNPVQPKGNKAESLISSASQLQSATASSPQTLSYERNRYWMPKHDINKKVIVQEIQYHLGPDATVLPYTREVLFYVTM